MVANVVTLSAPAQATAGSINNQINFQGRLLNAAGAVVADGNYNMQFKIYKDGDGAAAGDTGGSGGTLLWTEAWLGVNTQAVTVKNGYFSVNLGSVNPLTGVDFNQSVLWLSQNVAAGANATSNLCGTFAACNSSSDPELLPMRRLASAVYALQANSCTTCILQAPTSTAQNTISTSANGIVGLTVTSTGTTNTSLLSVTQSTSAFTGTAISVNMAAGSGTFASGNFLDLQANSASKFKVDFSGVATAATSLQAPLVDTASAVALNIGTNNATAINLNKPTTINTSVVASATAAMLQVGSTALVSGSSNGTYLGTNATTGYAGDFLNYQVNGVTQLKVTSSGSLQIFNSTTNSQALKLASNANGTLFNGDTVNSFVVNNGSYAPRNLLQNPGFETNAPATAGGWVLNSAAYVVDNTNAHTGNNELQITPTGAIINTYPAAYAQAAPGDQFYGEVWVKSSGTTNGTTSLFFQYYDKDKASIGFSAGATIPSAVTTYTLYRTTGTAPANTAYVRIGFGPVAASTTGTWYVDDVFFARQTDQTPMVFQNSGNSTTAFQIQNAAGTSNLFVADTSNNRIGIGNAAPNYTLDVTGTAAASTSVLTPLLDVASAGTLSVGTGFATTINVGTNAAAHTVAIGNGAAAQTVTLGSTNTTSATTIQGGTGNITLTSTASTVVKPSTDTAAAFQIQNAAGTNQINVNSLTTTNNLWPNPSFEQNIDGVALHGAATSVTHDGTGVTAQFGANTLKLVAPATANTGASFMFPFKGSTTYNISMWMRRDAGSASNINIGRADNGTDTDCATNLTITTTWTQFTCTSSFTTGTTIGNTSNFYVKVNSASASTIYIDGVTLVAASTALTYSLPGSALQVEPYANQLVFNAGNNPEIQPWQQGANQLPAARSRPAAVAANGYVYVLGGGTGVDGATPQTSIYYAKQNADGSLGAWTTQGSNLLNTAISNAGAVVINGFIYLVGGNTGSQSTVVQFARLNADGSTGAWATTTALPTARDGAGVTSYNGVMQVVGGGNGGGVTATTVYAKPNPDGTISSWTAGTTMNTTRQSIQTVISNGKIYVAGGDDGGGTNLTTYEYAPMNSDGSMGTWVAGASAMPVGRNKNSVFAVNGNIYTMGGWTGTSPSTQVYSAPILGDGSLGTWVTSANPIPIVNSTASLAGIDNQTAVALNGYMYLIGGDNDTTVQKWIYYTSTARVRINGSLDLTSANSTSVDPGSGGTLTAGNTNVVGMLQVAGTANFLNNVTLASGLTVGGNTIFKTSTNSTSGFQVQSSGSTTPVLNVDTTNARVGIGTATPGASLDLSSGGTIMGAGLSADCSTQYSKLLWSSSTKQFSCGTDRASLSIRKTADTNVTSSTTLVNISDFTFSIGANDTWAFQINDTGKAGTSGNYDYAVTAPSGATCDLTGVSLTTADSITSSTCGGRVELFQFASGIEEGHLTYGIVSTGATSGTVNFQMSQHASNATTTTMFGNSFLIAYKLTGADLAEIYYTTDPTIQPGDVVAIDPSAPGRVRKPTSQYDPTILGIISTKPGQVLGDAEGAPTGRPVMLALVGRIPVKVSTENGAIVAGDLLTSSSVPGIAMKATRPGQIIGKALENYSDSNNFGYVMTFAGQSYNNSNESNSMQGGTISADVLGGKVANIGDLNVSGTAILAKLSVTGAADIRGDLTVGGTTYLADLAVGGHIITGGATPTVTAGPAACSEPEVAVSGTDTAGTITVVTGTKNCTAPGSLASVLFAKQYTSVPKVILTPAGTEAPKLQYGVGSTTVSGFDLETQTPAAPGKTYTYNYFVIQ